MIGIWADSSKEKTITTEESGLPAIFLQDIAAPSARSLPFTEQEVGGW